MEAGRLRDSKIFWSNQGFDALEKVVKEDTDIVQLVKIKDEKGKDHSIESFLDKIKKLKVRIQN